MKQYNLKIFQDYDAENPRNYDCNLGFLITAESYAKADQNNDLRWIFSQAYRAKNCINAKNHIKKIKRLYKEKFGEKLVLIAPISKDGFGKRRVKYYLDSADRKNCRWDNELEGFYIITKDSLKTLHGSKRPKNKTLLKYIEAEIETYNKWANGEVFGFTLEEIDTRVIEGKEFINKEIVDSCWGFYNIEHIREYLPDSFKDADLNDYLI